MALLETWRNLAYGDGLDDKKREELWSGYFQIEKGIYELDIIAMSHSVYDDTPFNSVYQQITLTVY